MPLDSDLFEWHFTLRGVPNSSYADGLYHGRISLPPNYPLRPPSFRFVTPSGRFEVNREICLSISGHHEETWQPAWGLRTALVALRSFMETDPRGQLGGVDASDAVRRRLAAESRDWRCPACAKTNAEIMAASEEAAREAAASADTSTAEKEEVRIPEELTLAWRDEIGKTTDADGAGGSEQAEPLIQANSQGGDPSASDDGPQLQLQPQPQPQPQPGQGVPQPTRTVPLQTETRPLPPLIQAQRPSEDGLPLWIDRSVAILAVLLAALLIKILVGD